MASVEENQNKTPENTDKIEYKSHRSLFSIVNHLENQIIQLLNQNGNQSDNELLKRKIMQIYKSILTANITCNGQPVTFDEADLNTTSEFEPFDTGKEHYISNTLMGQLEQQMANTARLRKTGAAQVHSKLKKLMRPEMKHLYTVEVQTTTGHDTAMETDASGNAVSIQQDSVEERLQGTKNQEAVMEQMCTDMLQKAKDLVKAVHVYHKTESSEFQRVLCETPPTTPEITDQNCLQKANLDKNISKKLPI